MGEKRYIRNPKGETLAHVSDQDLEDFEQEEAIRAWLEREGKPGAVEFKYRSRKGTARNTLLKAQRLDGPIGEDGNRTLADIVAGSDGRDLECRDHSDAAFEGSETEINCLNDVLEIAEAVIDMVTNQCAREEIRRIYYEYLERSIA